MGATKMTGLSKKWLIWVGCGALSLGLSVDAWGIITRDDLSDDEYVVDDADYPALVDLFQPGDCIGTLIHPMYLLTVAHCAQDMNTNQSLTVNGVDRSVAEVILHPDWGGWNYDIALIGLDEPIEDIEPYGLYQETDENGQAMTLVGRGLHGTGIEGESGATMDRLLRRAHNAVSSVDNQWIEVRFESPDEDGILPLEGVGAAGDSGGPAFIEKDGQMLIAGLNSWGDGGIGIGVGEYGSFDYSTRVSQHLDWISNYVDLTQTTGTTNTGTTDTGTTGTGTIDIGTTADTDGGDDVNADDGESDSDGCGCNSTQGVGSWLALLALVGLVRRRSVTL